MAARSVRFHPDAIAEGQAAYEWYRDRNPSAANAFVAEPDHAIRQIQDNSEGWPMHMHGTRKFLFRRSLPGDLSDHRNPLSRSSLWLTDAVVPDIGSRDDFRKDELIISPALAG